MSSTIGGVGRSRGWVELLTEKVDMEECEMQVGDEPARERRNINVPYESLQPSSIQKTRTLLIKRTA
jgi:hypothetical protein